MYTICNAYFWLHRLNPGKCDFIKFDLNIWLKCLSYTHHIFIKLLNTVLKKKIYMYVVPIDLVGDIVVIRIYQWRIFSYTFCLSKIKQFQVQLCSSKLNQFTCPIFGYNWINFSWPILCDTSLSIKTITEYCVAFYI